MVREIELRERRLGVQRPTGFQKRGQIAGFKIKSERRTAGIQEGKSKQSCSCAQHRLWRNPLKTEKSRETYRDY
jgi:hypothetical protein